MPEPARPADHEAAYVAPPSDPAPPTASWAERLTLLTADPPVARRGALTAVGAVVAALAVAAALAWRAQAPAPPEVSLPVAGSEPAPPESTTTTASPDVVVHAAGAVVRPGVYRLAGGARVADLLDEAGGAGPQADLDRLNLAAALADGARVYVPVEGEAVPPVEAGGGEAVAGGAGDGTDQAAGAVVDVNTADAAALETLPGIGPATAAAILDERARRGRFAAVDELLEVRGIGEAKLAAIRDRVSAS